MARVYKKTSEMDPADPLTGSELVAIVQGGGDRRSTLAEIAGLGWTNYGYAAEGSGPGLSVDTSAQTVTVSGRVVAGRRTTLMPAPVVLPYTAGANQLISVSMDDGTALLTAASAAHAIPTNHAILGTLNPNNGQIIGAGGEYLLDGQRYMPPITIPKTTATADLWGTPSSVQVDTTAKTITFASGVRISDGRRTRTTNAYTLGYTGLTGNFFIVIDDSTGDPRLVPSNQLANTALVAEDDFVLGYFRTGTGRVYGLPGGFTLDGVEYLPDLPETSGPVVPEKVAENAQVWGTASTFQVDTSAQTITIASGARMSAGQRSRTTNAQVLSYAGQSGNLFIVYDDSNGDARLVPSNQLQNAALVTPDDLIVGRFQTADGSIIGLPGGYTLNGVQHLPEAPISYLTGEFYSSVNGGGITVDTSAQTITFSGWIVADGFSASLSSVVYNYSGIATQSGWRYLTYSKSNGNIGVVAASGLANLSSDRIVFLVFRPSELDFRGTTGGYSVDGIVYSTVSKESFLNGTLHTSSGATAVSFDTSTNTITFNGLIVADNFAATLSNVQYNYTGNQNQGGWRYLTYNTSTGGIGITTASAMANLPAGRIVFMAVRFSTLDVQGIPGTISIDGTYIGGPDRNYCIPLSDSATVDVDFIDKKVKISGNMQVLHRGFRVLIPQQEIDFSHIPDGVWSVLIYDPKTEIASATLASQRHGNLVLVLGAIKTNTQSVVGLTEYSINGVAERKRDTWTRRSVSLPWDFPYDITLPALPGHTSADPMPLATMTTDDIYSLYDALMADYPAYITKTLLGNDASGLLPIYEYRFTPEVARTEELAQGAPEHMRAMLLSLHSEQINYVYPYYLMRAICENWPADPALEALRFGVEWSVVPALNPYAVNNKQRPNFNGVDLNRNFPASWNLTSVGDFYSGPTPASEPETQYAYALLKSFRPHMVFDCHSFGQKAAPIADNVFWIGSADDKVRAAVGGVITRLGHKWRGENPWMPPPNRLGYTAGTRGSGLFRTTALDLGAASVLFEAAWSLADEPGGSTRGSALAVRYATEGLANCVVAVAKLISK